jgi:hypothetical protein
MPKFNEKNSIASGKKILKKIKKYIKIFCKIQKMW